MRFGAFTPLGLFRFAKTPRAKVHYDAITTALGKGKDGNSFDWKQGGLEIDASGTPIPGTGNHVEATCFATAKAIARADLTLERADNQRKGARAQEGLPELERRYGLVPSPTATLSDRRAAVVYAQRRSKGGARTNVIAELRLILGSNFIALRAPAPSERVTYPLSPANYRNTPDPHLVPRWVTCTDPVVITGTAIWSAYQNFDTSQPVDTLLAPGDVVLIDPDNFSQCEKITIAAVQGSGATRQFQATFTKSHDPGAVVTTQYWPWQAVSQRTFLVVVKAAAAIDPVLREKVHRVLEKLDTGVATWAIVEPTSPGALTIGPATLPFPLGCTTLGSVSFTPDP